LRLFGRSGVETNDLNIVLLQMTNFWSTEFAQLAAVSWDRNELRARCSAHTGPHPYSVFVEKDGMSQISTGACSWGAD
jgi:hypothetical protein